MLRLTTAYVFFGEKTREMLADDFIGLVAQQPFRAGIPIDDSSFRRHNKNGILADIGHQKIETLVGFLAR
jgi:hypothetical protein